MRQANRLFEANRRLTRADLVTLEPDDILQSSVFDDIEDKEPDDERQT
jgi:hypothetical protein